MPESAEKEAMLAAMQSHLSANQLPCTAAHAIADYFRVAPLDVGKMADDEGIVLSLCQLGLFGYGPKAEGKSKLMRRAPSVSAELRAALTSSAANGRIPCTRCWQLAAQMGVERLEIAEAAEALGLKIVVCQLGAF
jgi:hypothetical protein